MTDPPEIDLSRYQNKSLLLLAFAGVGLLLCAAHAVFLVSEPIEGKLVSLGYALFGAIVSVLSYVHFYNRLAPGPFGKTRQPLWSYQMCWLFALMCMFVFSAGSVEVLATMYFGVADKDFGGLPVMITIAFIMHLLWLSYREVLKVSPK